MFHKDIQNISAAEHTVISEIPPEDLDKSPAPVLPYTHTLYHPTFVESSSTELPDYFSALQYRNGDDETSSRDLPDYSSTIQSVDVGYLCLGVGVSIGDSPGTPPPCYEQAIEMAPFG